MLRLLEEFDPGQRVQGDDLGVVQADGGQAFIPGDQGLAAVKADVLQDKAGTPSASRICTSPRKFSRRIADALKLSSAPAGVRTRESARRRTANTADNGFRFIISTPCNYKRQGKDQAVTNSYTDVTFLPSSYAGESRTSTNMRK